MRDIYFAFGWKSHGGQGLGWTPRDVDELPLNDLQWYLERIADQRRAEANAINSK